MQNDDNTFKNQALGVQCWLLWIISQDGAVKQNGGVIQWDISRKLCECHVGRKYHTSIY